MAKGLRVTLMAERLRVKPRSLRTRLASMKHAQPIGYIKSKRGHVPVYSMAVFRRLQSSFKARPILTRAKRVSRFKEGQEEQAPAPEKNVTKLVKEAVAQAQERRRGTRHR